MLTSWANRDPEKAASLAASLPAGSAREQSLGQVAQQWAQTDAKAALEWTRNLPASEGQIRAISNVLQTWAQAEPAAAASDYVASMPRPADWQEKCDQLSVASGSW